MIRRWIQEGRRKDGGRTKERRRKSEGRAKEERRKDEGISHKWVLERDAESGISESRF
jgi:hypothetical protein